MIDKKEMALIVDNTDQILNSVRHGLKENINKIDLLNHIEFDFESGFMTLNLPAVEKKIQLKDILKLIEQHRKEKAV